MLNVLPLREQARSHKGSWLAEEPVANPDRAQTPRPAPPATHTPPHAARAGCPPRRSTPPAHRRSFRYCPESSPPPAPGSCPRPDVFMVSISIARAALPENGLTIAVGSASTKRVSQPAHSTRCRIPSRPKSSAPDARSTPTAHSIATRYGSRFLATSKPSLAPSTNAS